MAFCSELTGAAREDFYAQVLRRANRSDTFSGVSNIRITGVDAECVTGELTVTDSSLNPWGIVHGGCLSTLADTTAGTLIFVNGHKCVTLGCSINFLRPAAGPFIRCSARAQKLGRTTSVVTVSMTDDRDREVACGTYTFFNTGEVTAEDLAPVLRGGN